MTVPSRPESAALLLSLQPPAWHLRHSRAVAEVAGWLALRASRAGVVLDRRLTESAALLHDVDKLDSIKSQTNGLPHAQGSAAWLAAQGHAELGPAIVGHPVSLLADAAWFEAWSAAATPEALIVAYSDKRAGQRLESMKERFSSWARRYPSGTSQGWSAESVAAIWERSRSLEERTCRLAGVRPGEVARLPWTGPALLMARGA
jgi:hypothetical protein